MKFQTALLFAAAASFAFAQVSDVEVENNDVVAADEAGAVSDVDAPVEVNSPADEAATDAADAFDGEGSDDYELENSTDAADANVDDYDSPSDAADEADAGSDVENDDDNTTAIAAGAAGAAAAAVGLFVWASKSKKQDNVESLRSQFNMA